MKKLLVSVLVLTDIVFSFGIFFPSSSVEVEAWCTVNKNDGTVQCAYKTKNDCEDYRQVDETCVQNPEPNKQY